MKTVLILGSHSFADKSIKVGIMHIAEYLATKNYLVDYVPVPSSPIDLITKRTVKRFVRAWLSKIHTRKIKDNLYEHYVKSPWTTSKKTFRYKWQIKFYSLFLPSHIKKKKYDLVIHDVSTSAILSEGVNYKKIIFRVNDSPRGFIDHTGIAIVNWFESGIVNNKYDDIWASSSLQMDEVYSLNSSCESIIVPNGYNMDNFSYHKNKKFPNSVVYVGAISEWLDLELIEKTAKLMPDWSFKIYGPNLIGYIPKAINIEMMGAIDNALITSEIYKYSVGIIPYRNTGHVKKIERPIKFYEYLAAGLGIVAADIPSFRKGMNNEVFYANNEFEMVEAIKAARNRSKELTEEYIQSKLYDISWDKQFDNITKRI